MGLTLFVLPVLKAGATDVADAGRPFRGLAYKDAKSHVLIYVESDGRHVAAISESGTILWNKDPFVDAKLEPYRSAKPKIVGIGPPLKWMKKHMRPNRRYVAVSYDSTQFGIVDEYNGDLTFLGQD